MLTMSLPLSSSLTPTGRPALFLWWTTLSNAPNVEDTSFAVPESICLLVPLEDEGEIGGCLVSASYRAASASDSSAGLGNAGLCGDASDAGDEMDEEGE